MKKFLIRSLGVIVVLAVGLYVFRAPLTDLVMEQIVADMFVAADTDQFDPGVPLGRPLPAIRASHRGTELTDLSSFVGPSGIVLYAIRSVDW